MRSRVKIPTWTKLASDSYHLVHNVTVFYKFSLFIFPPPTAFDSSCSHVIHQASCSWILHKQSEKIKSQQEKGKPASPKYLSPLAFFSDKTEIIDCPICQQYGSTEYLVKSLNGSHHQSAQLSALKHASLILIVSNQITRSVQTLNHLDLLKCHC